MLNRIEFTPAAARQFRKLPPEVQKRIQEKLDFWIKLPNPLTFAKLLVELPPATHRFRIGKYRALFYWVESMIVITAIDTREDIYRRK